MKKYKKIIIAYYFMLIFILTAGGCADKKLLKNERDFQQAFNKVYFKGKAQMEVSVKYGRVDLVSDKFAVEVDRLSKFHEGIGQALHYAKETGKKPALAIFIVQPSKKKIKKLNYVKKLCKKYNIKVWYINEELE